MGVTPSLKSDAGFRLILERIHSNLVRSIQELKKKKIKKKKKKKKQTKKNNSKTYADS